MTLTIQVRPEKQHALAEQARRAGLTTEQYVERLVDQTTPTPEAAEIMAAALRQAAPAQQRAAHFKAWLDSRDKSIPPLPPEATSREALYSRDDE